MKKVTKIILGLVFVGIVGVLVFSLFPKQTEAVCWGDRPSGGGDYFSLRQTIEALPANEDMMMAPRGAEIPAGYTAVTWYSGANIEELVANTDASNSDELMEQIGAGNKDMANQAISHLKRTTVVRYLRDAKIEFIDMCVHNCEGGLVPCGRRCDDPNTDICECVSCTSCHFFILIRRIVDFLLTTIVPILLVLVILTGGVMYLTSSGDTEKARKAMEVFKVGAIGFVIALTAWLLVNVIMVFSTPNSTGEIFGTPWYGIDCEVE